MRCGVSAQPSRAVALLEEHDCISRFVPNAADSPAISRLIEQNTPVALKASGTAELEGLQLPAWRIALVTDREFFGQQTLGSSGYVRRRRKAASKTVDPNKMRPGDYVVHRNHGIGRFKAMEKLAISGDVRDYLAVQYADGILRVAADQLGTSANIRPTTEKPPRSARWGEQPGRRPKSEPVKRSVRLPLIW